MAELGNALAIVLSINVILFLGQIAVIEMNPDAGQSFYDCKKNMLGQFEGSGCTSGQYSLNSTNLNTLPNTAGELEIDSGNVFTDTFSAAFTWLTQSTGLSYLYNIVSAPANFLNAIGLPDAFSFAIGAMWYGFTLFLIIAFILGRDY